MTQSNAMVEGLANLSAMAEATVGYRKILIAGGMSEALADDLTRDYHATLILAARASFETQAKGQRR